jgi:hypothetical protein
VVLGFLTIALALAINWRLEGCLFCRLLDCRTVLSSRISVVAPVAENNICAAHIPNLSIFHSLNKWFESTDGGRLWLLVF